MADQSDPAARGSGVERVQGEIDDHLSKPLLMSHHPRPVGADVLESNPSLIRIVLEQAVHFASHRLQLHRLWNELGGTSKLHKVFENVLQPPNLVADQMEG